LWAFRHLKVTESWVGQLGLMLSGLFSVAVAVWIWRFICS
jgi:hypothetical protein